jgi:phosphonate transport system substrate-binding protein
MLRRMFAGLLLALCAASPAGAQGSDLVFAVTEGVTYQATPKEIRDRFAPLALVLGKATGRRARVVLVPAYDDLRAGLARREYDLAFVHPAHVAMAEIKAGRYAAVAWTSGYTEYTVSMLVNSGSALRTIDDLKGHTIVTPDPDSITAAMVRAMFRADSLPMSSAKDLSPSAVRVLTTRYQDAVPFYVENGFADAGATAANAVVKHWTEHGGVVFARSRPVPIKQFIVSTRLPAAEQRRLREALVNLRDVKGGREALEATGYKGFVAPNPAVETATIAWLGL